MERKIRVLVVDDSAFMRKLLVDIIESDPAFQVVKTARDGVEALKLVGELKPDVVTMDIELPEIDGVTCVVYIMEEFPTPVIMVTGFSRFMGEATIKALEYGALGLVRKPMRPITENMEGLRQELISQIRLVSQVDDRKLSPVIIKETIEKVEKPVFRSTNKIVAIASSSGGPRALSQIIPKLPPDLPAGVLVVQHIPYEFVSSLADRMNKESFLAVKVAEHQESIQQGKVLFAPSNCHCRIESKRHGEEIIKLAPVSREEKYPLLSANRLMTSLAPVYGRNSTGVVLTGMGNDGTEGLRAIRKYGGHTIVEHKSTCIVNGMPRSAIQAGVVNKTVPLHQIADEIVKTVGG